MPSITQTVTLILILLITLTLTLTTDVAFRIYILYYAFGKSTSLRCGAKTVINVVMGWTVRTVLLHVRYDFKVCLLTAIRQWFVLPSGALQALV